MKKILLFASIFLIVGCATKYAESQAKVRKITSDFDGTTTLTSNISQSWTKSGWMSGGVGFNGFATQGKKELMIVEVTFINSVTSLEKLHLNIDGVFSEHDGLGITKVTYGPSSKLPMSTRGFFIKTSTVNQIKNAKSVKFRVTTLSDGAREGELVRDKKLSPAAMSIINIAEQLN